MLVKMGSSSPNRGENRKYSKPPPSISYIHISNCTVYMDDDYSCKPFGYEQIQYHVESALGMDSPKNLQVLGAH